MNLTQEKTDIDDTKIENGSIECIAIDKKRTWTDIPSLIIFTSLLICYVGIALHAFNSGDITKIQLEVDAEVRRKVDSIAGLLEDISVARYFIFSLLTLAFLLSILFVLILRWIPEFVINITIVVEYAVLTISVVILAFSFTLGGQIRFFKLLSLIIFITLTSIKLYILRKVGSKVICEVIKESCRVILHFPCSIILSVFVFMLELFSVLYTLNIFVYLLTIKSYYKKVVMSTMDKCHCPSELMYYNGSNCDEAVFNRMCKPIDGVGSCMISSCTTYLATPFYIYLFHTINLIFGLWLVSAIFYFGRMILSKTFATWYWTMNKKSIPLATIARSFVEITKYHQGTLAYGTSPWVIVPIIRTILSTFNSTEFWDHPISMLVCWWTIFYKSADNALTLCAIHGNGMLQSLKMGVNLCSRNPLKFFIINKASEWVSAFLTIFVFLGIMTTIFGFTVIQNYDSTWVSMVLIGIIVGSIIITFPIVILLSISMNTIILCIFVDLQNNEKSKNKTYYMNNKLRYLLVAE